jgi:broad specificity phosphatase PhoE
MTESQQGAYGEAIARFLGELREDGVEHTVALIRHSAREFEPGRHDLENPLTDAGRVLALDFGSSLPRDLFVRAYASPVSRCMETAALALQGHRTQGGASGRHRPVEGLGVFYILDQMKMYRAMTSAQEAERSFLRDWFDGRLASDIMIPARQSAEILVRLLLEKLEQQRGLGGPALDLCVTHDMTLYLVREQVLGLRPEDNADIDFLDGLVVFERDADVRIRAAETGPVPLRSFLEGAGRR